MKIKLFGARRMNFERMEGIKTFESEKLKN